MTRRPRVDKIPRSHTGHFYHYPDPDDLAEVVIQSLYQRYAAPSVEMIPGDEPLAVRVATLIHELYGIYEPSSEAYRIYQKSATHPAMKKASAEWEQTVGAMLMRTLGERAVDREAVKLLSVLINPGFRGTLLMSGFEPERAVEVATELAQKWLE